MPADAVTGLAGDYTPETVSRLEFIRRGRAAGLPLTQTGDILAVRDVGQAPCVHVRDLLAEQLRDLDDRIAELTALRAAVAEFHDAAATGIPQPATHSASAYL